MANEKRHLAAHDVVRSRFAFGGGLLAATRHTERRALARSLFPPRDAVRPVSPIVKLDDDSADAVAYLNGAATRDASRPEIRDLALRIRRVHPDDEAFARAVQALVKRSVRFVREVRETFQHARHTLRRRAGDCDDHARAVVALARAGGGKARLIGFPNARGILGHVAPLLWDGRRFRWAETTFDARFGEFPSAAARRLGVARTGLWAERRKLVLGSRVVVTRSAAHA